MQIRDDKDAMQDVNALPLGRPNRLGNRGYNDRSDDIPIRHDPYHVAAHREAFKRPGRIPWPHPKRMKPAGSEEREVGTEMKSNEEARPKDSSRTSFAPHLFPEAPASPKPIVLWSRTKPETTFEKRELDKDVDMGAAKRMSNGEPKPIGPHPSTIRVSAPFSSQAALDRKLQPASSDTHERSVAEARESSVRLQGVAWLDNVRRALQLPIRTYTTACVYYHKFRLANPTGEYDWTHAAAASLLTACKVEDTLKKSRDILAAAYNLKSQNALEQLGSDDPIFEAPSRMVIGLERLVLESSGFDFRSPHSQSHPLIVKICRGIDAEGKEKVGRIAWTILTDLYRTFAPLKQTSATLAIASTELAARLHDSASATDASSKLLQALTAIDLTFWSVSREEVMETLLDGLDLYTQHTTSTILGTKYSLDDFLRVRLALNKECTEPRIPRYTTAPSSTHEGTGNTLKVQNGHPTPVSPPQPGTQQPQSDGSTQIAFPPIPEGGGTLRFMLNPQLAADEKSDVQKFFNEEWEEYEEEIEVPDPAPARTRSRDRIAEGAERRGPREPSARSEQHSDLDSRRGGRRFDDRPPPGPPRGLRRDDRERFEMDRERDYDRARPRERPGRFDDRRYDDRDRRRFDDRGGRGRYEGRFDRR